MSSTRKGVLSVRCKETDYFSGGVDVSSSLQKTDRSRVVFGAKEE